MTFLGGTSFELLNALAWIGAGVGFAIAFAYLLDVINRRAFQLKRQLEKEKQLLENEKQRSEGHCQVKPKQVKSSVRLWY